MVDYLHTVQHILNEAANTATQTATLRLGVQTDADYPLSAVGPSTVVTATVTRPGGTTTYAAGDALSDSTGSPSVLTFSNVARGNTGSAFIVGASMVASEAPDTKGSFELWLFDTSPTAMEDNAAFDPSDAEVRNVVAIAAFSAWFEGTSGTSGNCVSFGTVYPDKALVHCASGTKALYGAVAVRNAYVPSSAARFDFALEVAQN